MSFAESSFEIIEREIAHLVLEVVEVHVGDSARFVGRGVVEVTGRVAKGGC